MIIDLKLHRNLTKMAQFFEWNVTELNSKPNILIIPKQNVCICCHESSKVLINLKTCKHRGFFDLLPRSMVVYEDQIFVCCSCHRVLHNIQRFKEQVEESFSLLKHIDTTTNVSTRKKLHNLKRTEVLLIENKSANLLISANDASEATTFTIKVEPDWSEVHCEAQEIQLPSEISHSQKSSEKNKPYQNDDQKSETTRNKEVTVNIEDDSAFQFVDCQFVNESNDKSLNNQDCANIDANLSANTKQSQNDDDIDESVNDFDDSQADNDNDDVRDTNDHDDVNSDVSYETEASCDDDESDESLLGPKPKKSRAGEGDNSSFNSDDESLTDADDDSRNDNLNTEAQNLENSWQSTTADIPKFPFDDSSIGVTFNIDENTTPKDVFDKLFPATILDDILAKTNANGKEISGERKSSKNSRLHNFKAFTSEEMLKFLGLCLLMGEVNVPDRKKLFTYTDPLFYHPIFQYVMSARKFEALLKCLSPGTPGNTFMKTLTENFRDCYKPSKDLSLAEPLTLFKGRLKGNPNKDGYGIKFIELSSDDVVLNVIQAEHTDITETEHTSAKLVLKVMKPYLSKGYSLFLDSYYNSVKLSEKLLKLNTHVIGILQENRKGNPKLVTKRKLQKNELTWQRRNKVYVSKSFEKKPVIISTTANHPKLINVPTRKGKRIISEELFMYGQAMSKHRAEQISTYFSTPRRCLSWNKKAFFHMLDLAVWNSFIIYRKHCKNDDKKYTYIMFREDLLKQLIQLPANLKLHTLLNLNMNDNRMRERSFVCPKVTVGSFDHWPEFIPVRDGFKRSNVYKNCRLCSKKKVRRETKFRCKGCEDEVPLCAVCFEEWHSLPKTTKGVR